MKSPAATIPVVTNITGATTQRLTVKADGKLFNLLADKVYTDKVKACVRETWSNALDSHVAAGNPAKFKVTLPTRLDPTFTVRDYGVGMDHETVLGLYSELLTSSKDDDNTQTGFLGIGSKSPLAVSDAFTVTCYDGAEQRSYLISIDAEGGVITQLGASPSSEPRGVEVQVPVNVDQLTEFAEKAAVVAFGFKDDAPEGVDFDYPEAELSGTYITTRPDGEEDVFGWEILSTDLLENGGLYVRQGPVVYPVPREAIPSSNVLRYNSACSLVVDIPLGTADVSPDRESLSLDPATRENLREKLTTVFTEVNVAAELQRMAAGNWYNQTKVAESQARWGSFGDADTRLYVTGGSDWDVPTFLTGKKWGSLITRPTQTRRHPLAPDTVPATHGAVSIRREEVHNHVFYILRPGTVRAAERVRRDAKDRTPGYGRSRHSTYLHLLDNPSSRQVERLVTLLGLKPHQLVPVSTIPDIPPPSKARPRAADGTPAGPRPKRLTGVYGFDNGSVELLEELPEDYLWVRSSSRAAGHYVNTFTSHGVTRRCEQAAVYGAVPQSILTQLGLPTVIVGFSDKAVAAHKPDPARELHVAVDDAVTAELLEKAATVESIESAVDTLYYQSPITSSSVVRELVAEFMPEGYEFGAEYDLFNRSWWINLTPARGYREEDEVKEAIVKAVTDAYPMLVKRSLSAEDVAEYKALLKKEG